MLLLMFLILDMIEEIFEFVSMLKPLELVLALLISERFYLNFSVWKAGLIALQYFSI